MAIPIIAGVGTAVGAGSTAYVVADFFGLTPDAFQSYYDEFSGNIGDFLNYKQTAYTPGRRSKYSRKPNTPTTRKGRTSKDDSRSSTPSVSGSIIDNVTNGIRTADKQLDNIGNFASEHGDSIEKIALLTAAIQPKSASIGAAALLLTDIASGAYSERSNEANPTSLLQKLKPILTVLAVGRLSEKL